MKLSEINIIPIKPKNGLIAFSSFIIDECLYVGNVAIYTSPLSQKGYRLIYPTKVLPNGKQINCVHPINKETGTIITEAIIDELMKLEKVMNYDKYSKK